MPKVLEDFLQKAFISMTGSLTQFFIFGSLGTTGFSWLAVKEYNHYWIIVTLAATHSQLVLGAGEHSLALWLHGRWIGCVPDGPAEVQWPNHISQFYCDFMPLLRLACSDPRVSGPGDKIHSFIVWLSHYSFWTDSNVLCLDCGDRIGSSCCGQQEKGSPTWSSYLAITFTCCEILIVFYITVSAHPHSGYYPALSDGHHHLQSSDLPSWEQVGSLSTEEAALIRKLTHLTYKGGCWYFLLGVQMSPLRSLPRMFEKYIIVYSLVPL